MEDFTYTPEKLLQFQASLLRLASLAETAREPQETLAREALELEVLGQRVSQAAMARERRAC